MTMILKRSISSKSTIALSKKLNRVKLINPTSKATNTNNNNNNNNNDTKDPTTSTTYRGRQFELETLKAFEKIGMSLLHIGGKSDGGIDLKGEWVFMENKLTTLPKKEENIDNSTNNSKKVSVIIQCKNVKNGCTPDHLRSLLGATLGWNQYYLQQNAHHHHQQNRKVLGILVSSSSKPFTSDTMQLFNTSQLPLGLARVQQSILQDLILNHVAQQWLPIQIHPRYNPLGQPISPLIMTLDGKVVK
ncbi:hypothetical protein BJ944DRAFT_123469 [Cunninghamella echinulata]|nr:hypothetical protein BJ944DRAFT_123469 [Cunninghamella echinulata]